MARSVARTSSRTSFDRSWVGHRGGFSRLESGTTTPLPSPPEVAWRPCGFPSREKKKRKEKKKDMKWYVVIGAKGILRCSTKNVY